MLFRSLDKTTSLSKADDGYFVDYYSLIMDNMIKLATQQDDLTTARLTLKEFINQTNPRLGLVYNQLYKITLRSILNQNSKKSSLALALMQEFNFKLTEQQEKSISLLRSLEENKDLASLKNEIKAFNRAFIGTKIPDEFLVALAPAVIKYNLNNSNNNPLLSLRKSVNERSTLFAENIAVVTQNDNIEAFAKGIELISKSDKMVKSILKTTDISQASLITDLQSISLKANSNNAELWHLFVNNLFINDEISKIYDNIKIEELPTSVIFINNDILLDRATEAIQEKSITNILNEIVFREDANKDFYTNKTIELVEKALRVEIEKSNLDGIFEYLNYVPSIKSKFKDELNERLNEYINQAWDNNNFENLNNLISLHSDLNDKTTNNILVELFEQYLLEPDRQNFFETNNIKELIEISDSSNSEKDLAIKYNFVIGNLKNSDIQTTLFSIARKTKGIYSQTKLFSYFSEVFSKEKVDDLIIDSINSALESDSKKELLNLIKLAGFLMDKASRLPQNYIKNEISPRFKTLEDIKQSWSAANKATRKQLIKYNKDIEYIIKVIENDKANKKITAASFIEKITSDEFLPFVKKYQELYSSYVSQIEGYYIKDNPKGGPEIIKVSRTDELLKVTVDYISRLGAIENLNKYKLDRGEVITKQFINHYNPISSSITLKGKLKAKELKVFNKDKNLKFDGTFLTLGKQKYHKVAKLFSLNKRFGISEQITEKTQDNFHILPEGSSFIITKEISENTFVIKIKHPANAEIITTNAKFNPQTAEFSFVYDYSIKLFDKKFSAKAKCQLANTRAFCTVQDKYWKRQEYSVVLKALEVK